MYVIPFCMGPPSSPLAKIGVQVTDSAYVVVNMRIMAHMGSHILKQLEDEKSGTAPKVRDGHTMFIPCAHTSGMPLSNPAKKTSLGPAMTTNISATSPRPAKSGLMVPAMVATPC